MYGQLTNNGAISAVENEVGERLRRVRSALEQGA